MTSAENSVLSTAVMDRVFITDASTTSYGSDAAGNRTQITDVTGTTYFGYDALSRMTTSNPAAGVTTMVYNADGQRVRKESPDGTIVNFLYDGNNLLHESDGENDPLRTYTMTGTGEGGFGDLISEYSEAGDGGEYYHQFDAQASTNALLDSDGSVVQSLRYQAFGLPIPSGGGTPDSALLWGGHKGYYYDADTELYLLGGGTHGRHYDPHTGRFVSDDPLRHAAGDNNLQRYVGNNPVNLIDPNGQQEYPVDDPNLPPGGQVHLSAQMAILNAASGGRIGVAAQRSGFMEGYDPNDDETNMQIRSLRWTQESFDRTGISKAMGVADAASKATVQASGWLVAGFFAPEATLAVGIGAGLASFGNSMNDRLTQRQTTGQAIKGGLADTFSLTSLYAGFTNRDWATQQKLGWNPYQQGEALGGGAVGVAGNLMAGGLLLRGGAGLLFDGPAVRPGNGIPDFETYLETTRTRLLENRSAENPLAAENVFRGDADLMAQTNLKGIPKSHLDEAGNLAPANPSGLYNDRPVSVTEHLLGGFRRGAKSNSPFTSFTPNGAIAEGYGAQQITVDLTSLRSAISSGEVKGVEIINQAEIQKLIQSDPAFSQYWKNMASRFAVRDQEVFIRGVIPSKFIKVSTNVVNPAP